MHHTMPRVCLHVANSKDNAAQRCKFSFFVDGDRDLRPALCVLRSSPECLATIRTIIYMAVRNPAVHFILLVANLESGWRNSVPVLCSFE